MNYSGIVYESIVDGEGVRTVLFVSGCKHNCKGCHNKDAQDFNNGRPFTKEVEDKIIKFIKETPFISGLTISGGDPMFSAKELIPFVERFEDECPDKDVWLYTGFLFEDIAFVKAKGDEDKYNLLELIDVVVDGKYDGENYDPEPFRGSGNQRIIDVRWSIQSGEVREWM